MTKVPDAQKADRDKVKPVWTGSSAYRGSSGSDARYVLVLVIIGVLLVLLV